MIRVRGRGKYELLSAACDDDSASSDQALGVEGVLNKRRDDDSLGTDPSDGATASSGPRHRKSSREKEEKRRLLGRSGSKSEGEMIELSEKMLHSTNANPSASAVWNTDFIEVDINSDDTLQGLALKFRCPVSELKRINNIYSTQDIHSFKRIKVPVKKHGLLKEILDDEASKRRSKRGKASKRGVAALDPPVDSLVRVDCDDDDDEEEEEEEEDDDDDGVKNSRWNSPLGRKNGDGSETSAANCDTSLLPACHYGIKDLENLFPNRDISDCESGAESRRLSATGGGGGGGSDSGSDSATTPLVRTFYLSIRENMSSPDQSSLAKQFLSKMDADLSTIRRTHSTAKNNLEEVTSTLTSKRIHPLSPSPPPPSVDSEETYGTIFGMSWRTLLGLGVGFGILLFLVFFGYAKQQKDAPSP